ncbi:DUF2834 domain-containing protein [Deinococcus frigens]|uniref:DUF2834 domain-containing protein n=1 Tax=Deinococcus frigens TaxID=249403 RepID=UPI00068ADACA|nr:DUF2834 domain-containing protein [Deinococcus frigens]
MPQGWSLLLPCGQFLPWIADNGLDLSALVQQATATRLAAFALADVLISVLTIMAMILAEWRWDQVRLAWLPLLGCVTIGASFGLPLYLYLRERARSA